MPGFNISNHNYHSSYDLYSWSLFTHFEMALFDFFEEENDDEERSIHLTNKLTLDSDFNNLSIGFYKQTEGLDTSCYYIGFTVDSKNNEHALFTLIEQLFSTPIEITDTDEDSLVTLEFMDIESFVKNVHTIMSVTNLTNEARLRMEYFLHELEQA